MLAKFGRNLTYFVFLSFFRFLAHHQRMRMVSLDAIISGSHTQWFFGHLKIIFSSKMAKNARFFYTLPGLSAKLIFWFFTHRPVFGGLLGIWFGKLKFFQKLDTQIFPTIYHEPRFDIRKAAKCFRKVRGPFSDVNLKYFCNFWTSKICFFQMCV